jgi:hypothetical protein
MQEDAMIRISLEYDSTAKYFKLVGIGFDTLAEGDALYDLSLDMLFDEAAVADLIPATTLIARA